MSAKASDAALDEYLGKVEEGLREGVLPIDMFNDPAIFKAELERIFTRNWVFVAHVSEIPKAGDYVLRRIGLDSVIVSRDGDGKINVMSSHCRHRGTELCVADKGNTEHFVCPYHGWTYGINGDWKGAPQLKEAYGQRLDAKKWGLLHAPHVDVHQGLIFASLDPEAKPLKEYLGGMAWLLDAFLGLAPEGMRVVAPPERYKVRANWKTAAENFSGDVYHVNNLHASTVRVVDASFPLATSMTFARTYEFPEGHNSLGHEWAGIVGAPMPFGGSPPHFIERYDVSRLDEAQLLMMRDKPPTVGTVFPNFSFIRFPAFRVLNEPPVILTSIRQWQPIGPDEFELWNWQLVWNFQDDADIERTYNISQYSFGSAGIFEQDDTVAWEGAVKVGASPWWRRTGTSFHFQAREAERSSVDQSPDPTWKGPGVHRLTGVGEYAQIGFYREWLRVMRENRG